MDCAPLAVNRMINRGQLAPDMMKLVQHGTRAFRYVDFERTKALYMMRKRAGRPVEKTETIVKNVMESAMATETATVNLGIFAEPGREIAPNVADTLQKRRLSVVPIGGNTAPAGDPDTEMGNLAAFNAAKLKKEKLTAEKLDLELRIARGRSLDVEAVGIFLYNLAVDTRQALLAIGPRLAPLVAAEKDPVAVARMIEAEIYRALDKLVALDTYATTPGGDN